MYTLVLRHLPVTFTVIKYQGILLYLIFYLVSQLKQSTIFRLLRNNLRTDNIGKSTSDKLYIFMSSIKWCNECYNLDVYISLRIMQAVWIFALSNLRDRRLIHKDFCHELRNLTIWLNIILPRYNYGALQLTDTHKNRVIRFSTSLLNGDRVCHELFRRQRSTTQLVIVSPKLSASVFQGTR